LRPCGDHETEQAERDSAEQRALRATRGLLDAYFEGAGGQTLGQHGYSKDHRPDLRQMILAVLIDGDGRPVCSEMWPGNTADVTTLIPVIDRLRRRFDIARVCVVADRGTISTETMAELEARRLLYILGVRERSDKLVRELVLDDPAPFVPLVMKKRGKEIDYEAKTVMLAGRCYIVCPTARRLRRMPPIGLRSWPHWSASSPRATRHWSATGFRRYLKTISEEQFAIDSEKIEAEKKFDGIFVLRTNTDLNPLEAMLCYKQLWTVADLSNSKASVLHPAGLPQARRDHPRSRVLQLPRARAEVGAGEAHCRSRSLRLLAGDHRGSGFTDRDRDRVRRQTLHRSLGAALGCQPGPAGRRRRAAADRPRRRSLLIPPQRKCSAKPPVRLELPCLFSYLVNRTVEDGLGAQSPDEE
jgi:Transposase DDE domain